MKVTIEGGQNLLPGNNTIRIICTAEDGTKATYIIAKRATQNGQNIESQTTAQNSSNSSESGPVASTNLKLGIPIWLSPLVALALYSLE